MRNGRVLQYEFHPKNNQVSIACAFSNQLPGSLIGRGAAALLGAALRAAPRSA